MTEEQPTSGAGDRPATTFRTVEMLIAALALVFGAIVMADSWRVGAAWGDDGPQAGYFPFYIGLMIVGASGWTFWSAQRRRPQGDDTFVTRRQLRQILSLLVPALLYAIAIRFVGIYVASFVFVAYFMARHGAHRLWTTALVSLGLPLALFLMFEVWFKTPLPKGPIEALLGLD